MTEQNDGTKELMADIEAILADKGPDLAKRIGNAGFIHLESWWGNEATILNAARLSVSNKRVKESPLELQSKDIELLRHLISNNHGTPFETVSFRFHFVAPIFVLRQWVKHRISSWNEFSMRYRKPISTFYVPDQAARSIDGYEVLTLQQLAKYCKLMDKITAFYEQEYAETCERIQFDRGMGLIKPATDGRDPLRARARELLRNAMPVSQYSDVQWTVNFRSLLNFFNLRMKDSAQYEIREYAHAAFDIVKTTHPILCGIVEDVYGLKHGKTDI